MEIRGIEKIINDFDAERRRLLAVRGDIAGRIESTEKRLAAVDDLAEIVQSVLQHTQTVVVQSITDLVNRAFDVVFGGTYQFEIEFDVKRGRVWANVWFLRDGVRIAPTDAVGGGVVDVASLVLRVAFWALKKSTIPVIVFDEPLKFLSAEYRELAGDILTALSREMGLQIVMVSHIPEFFVPADRIISVSIVNGESVVKS